MLLRHDGLQVREFSENHKIPEKCNEIVNEIATKTTEFVNRPEVWIY